MTRDIEDLQNSFVVRSQLHLFIFIYDTINTVTESLHDKMVVILWAWKEEGERHYNEVQHGVAGGFVFSCLDKLGKKTSEAVAKKALFSKLYHLQGMEFKISRPCCNASVTTHQ